jgi:hypothetical protein
MKGTLAWLGVQINHQSDSTLNGWFFIAWAIVVVALIVADLRLTHHRQ